MNMGDERARAYLEEAKLSIETAKAALERAERTQQKLWHAVVKSSYDAMEQAISAMLVNSGVEIPKSHPGKVEKFVNEFGESDITERIYRWLGRRSKTQYVDVEKGEVVVPHKIFDRADAKEALADAERAVKKADSVLPEE